MPGSSSTTRIRITMCLASYSPSHLPQDHGEPAALARFAGQADLTAMRVYDMAHHGQTDTGALDAQSLGIRAPHELVEDLLLLARGNSQAAIAHRDRNAVGLVLHIH